MQITFDQTKNRYYFDVSFEDRAIPKKHGFKWCDIENRWFTDNWYVALQAAKIRLDMPSELAQYFVNVGSSSEKDEDPIAQNNNSLFSYQTAGVAAIRKRRNILLADEQGLGKTAQAITYVKFFQEEGDFTPSVLVICPSSLKINWQREFIKWLPQIEYPYSEQNDWEGIQIVRTGKDKIIQNKLVVILNYDLLKSRLIADQLAEYDADVVILDEAHYLKNPTSLRTKAALKLAKKAKKTIAITGTPVLNRPIELFPLLNAISPETIAPYDTFRKFALYFCGAYEGRWGFITDGATNIEELNTRLRATCMIRRLKKDVLDQLPDKMPPQIIALEQDSATKAVIKLEKTLDIEDLKRHPEKMNLGDAARIRHELALAKLPKCIEYIEERLLSGNKIVVFAYHRDVISDLQMNLEGRGYDTTVLLGGMSAEYKQLNIDKFQTNPNCKIFIGQIQAAGVGITLTAASDVIFVESSWTPGEIDQCIDRCHRIGQKNSVTSTFLTVENSIEETMLKVVFDKAKIINQILK